MRIVIFSNGSFAHAEMDRSKVRESDLLIAADGGLHHCQALGLRPDVVIGDLDSVEDPLIKDLKNRGVEIQEHPARKDSTDLELALEYAIERSPDRVLILGGLGGRWDQTLANILLLSQNRFRGPRIQLIDGPQQIEMIPAGNSLEITGAPGSIVSLIPIHGDAHGITTHGLEYELEEGKLVYGATRGVSNVLVQGAARISIAEGLLMCIVIEPGYQTIEA